MASPPQEYNFATIPQIRGRTLVRGEILKYGRAGSRGVAAYMSGRPNESAAPHRAAYRAPQIHMTAHFDLPCAEFGVGTMGPRSRHRLVPHILIGRRGAILS